MNPEFLTPLYDSARIPLVAGSIMVGAVFPNADGTARWRLFGFGAQPAIEHTARTIALAREHLMQAWADTLRRAALSPSTWSTANDLP